MKRLVVGLALLAVACSGTTPSSPSSSETLGSVAPAVAPIPEAEPPKVEPNPPAPGANATTPQYTLTGPRGCVSAGTDPITWVLTVTDAGPRPFHLVTMTPADDAPGCEATVKRHANGLAMSGVTHYAPQTSGQTTFIFDPKRYNCGRVQVDISMIDSTGKDTLVLGMLVNYGTTCAPPPVNPPSSVCTPAAQAGVANAPVNFSSTGTSTVYTWSAPGGTPASGTGPAFTTSFPGAPSTSTTYSVTLTTDSGVSTCTVTIPPTTTGTLICVPPNQTTGLNTPITVTASGVPGPYTWTAATGSPSSGSGASTNFTTQYSTTGTKTITVQAGGQTATCNVLVQTVTLVCAPPNQNVAPNQTATVTASGGDGSYTWSAPGGSTPSGSGATFGTSYPTGGARVITVTSAGQTATCNVTVVENPLVCAPPTQTVSVNQTASVSATGGTGTYSWSAPGGSTTSGTGATFTTSYATSGTRLVTVTSGSQTASCQVVVPDPPLVCAPPTQTVAVGQPASLSASGGNGTYSWSAPGGSTAAGTGATFSTSYATSGTRSVTVTSGGQTATCQVVVPPDPLLVCAPPTQTVAIGATATVGATGGSGAYSWSAPGATTTTGSGPSFSTAYASAGTRSITVTSGGQTATCQVIVPPPTLCPPPGGFSFTARWPVLASISGEATVNGPGVWTLTMYSTATVAQYESDQPNSVKEVHTVTLVCADPMTPVSAELVVNHWPGDHPDRYWWITLVRNGTRVYKSPVQFIPLP